MKRTTSASIMAAVVLVTLSAYASTETTTIELTDAEIENIVRRSYQ
jgi:hypothetical protein